MKITSSWYFRIGLGVLCVVIILEGALVWANFLTRRRAEALLASLQAMKIGDSIEEVQPILSSYNAQKDTTANCYSVPSAASYSIWVTNNTVDYLGYTFPMLLRLGVRPVSFTAMLSFADDRLCQAYYSSGVLVSGSRFSDEQQKGMMAIELTAATRMVASQKGPPQANYSVRPLGSLLPGFRWQGWHFGIEAEVTPSATPTEIKHAMTFDFSCFTSIRGCITAGEMLPLVAEDAAQAGGTKLP
jgi:hypothetical protein